MATYLRLVWPYGVMMLVIAGASLFFGADTRMTALLFSGLLLLLGGVVTLQRRRVKLPPLMIAALVALPLPLEFGRIGHRVFFVRL